MRPLGEEYDLHSEFRTIEEMKTDRYNTVEHYDEQYDEAMNYVELPTDQKKLLHWKELDNDEAQEIMYRLTDGVSFEIPVKQDVYDHKMEDLLDKMYLTKRFKLDYAKLFNGYEGGYPIEKL